MHQRLICISMCILNIMYCDTLMYHSFVPSLANVQQKIPSSHYMIMNIKMYIQDNVIDTII